MTAREQEELVQRVLDGETRPEDVPVFQALFRDDPAFRRRYQEHAFLVFCLETSGNPGLTLNRNAQDVALARQGRKLLARSLGWAAAAVIILSLVARTIYLQHRRNAESGRLSFADGTRLEIQPADEGGNPADPTPSRTMEPGTTLILAQGVAEVEFPSGLRAWLAGSAQLTYHGKGDFHLDHGKVWFEIPQGADGVVLTTPRIRVVDQGTEFGVISEGAYSDEIHVQSGQVLVEALIGRKEQTVVRATKAVAVDFVGRIADHRMDAGVFSRKLPRCLPYLHWSFDALEDGGFAATGEHPRLDTIHAQYRSVRVTPDAQRGGMGVIGSSVRFAQPGDLVVTSYPGVKGNAPRTLSFWLRLPPERSAEYASGNWIGLLGWGRRHYPQEKFTESIHAIVGAPHLPRPQGTAAAAAAGLVPILSFEGIWFEGETDLADGGWHHLVWIFSGKSSVDGAPEMTCYCDGRAEPLLIGGLSSERLAHWPPRIDTVVDDEESVPLIFGGSLLAIDDHESWASAELDEIHVIEGVVGPAVVRRLFLENRYEPAPAQQIPAEGPGNGQESANKPD